MLRLSGGDARKLLNILELVCSQVHETQPLNIEDALVTNVVQQNLAIYDKSGEMHYDLISAFIKSIRGSAPDASVYYLARMITGGEDPLFICRRMIILAAEDIGLANPNALLMANNCFQAVHQIGMPEGRIVMSQCAIYLACSPKSNSAYMAIEDALASVQNFGNLSVPLHLRNAPTKLMKDLNYAKDYKYAHHYENNFVNMEYLPEILKNVQFYQPGNNATESKYKEWLENLSRTKH
jgi:putative ATPase